MATFAEGIVNFPVGRLIALFAYRAQKFVRAPAGVFATYYGKAYSHVHYVGDQVVTLERMNLNVYRVYVRLS